MSYDAWLEQPYIAAAHEDRLHELFQQSPDYADAFDAWLMDSYEGDDDDRRRR